ncbi:MAG: hypothetical protein LBU62_02740 [Bacteroidales bacterium]|jgi:hypothetical protein|nr:hypothetical protein [Bacteroidales bacterium]
MKKLVFFAAVAATVFSFNSCSKDDPAAAVNPDIFTDKATIEGVAYIQNAYGQSASDTYAPEGTKLSFSIPYSGSYGLGVAGSSGYYVATATVGANGAYSVELPARADGKPVQVAISSDDFIFDTAQENGDKKSVVYSLGTTSQYIVAGLKYEKVLQYTSNGLISESETWTSGTFKATLKYYDGAAEQNVPAGTKVTITIPRNAFVPAKVEDVILVKEVVGANGLLTFTHDAPTLENGGLSFTIAFDFAAEHVIAGVNDPKEIAYYYYYDSDAIFGGQSIEKILKVDTYSNSTLVAAPSNYTKDAKYSGTWSYYKNAVQTDDNKASIPAGKQVIVTIPYYYPPTYSTRSLSFVTTVGSNGLISFTVKAPAFEEYTSGFSTTIEVSFIADYTTSSTTKPYLYTISKSTAIFGDRAINETVTPTASRIEVPGESL